MKNNAKKKILLGISGATGFEYAVRMIHLLKAHGVEVHLIISKAAEQTRDIETHYCSKEIKDMADEVYSNNDMTAAVASGSYLIDAMIILPCSVKMLAEVANGYGASLISRAADVMLKERRKLVLAVRETPLSRIHLENMLKLTDAGGVVMPPLPAFYTQPETIDDLIDDTVARAAEFLGVEVKNIKRWNGKSLQCKI